MTRKRERYSVGPKQLDNLPFVKNVDDLMQKRRNNNDKAKGNAIMLDPSNLITYLTN